MVTISYSDSESVLELSTSMDEFLDFFFMDSKKSFTKTFGGTMSMRKKKGHISYHCCLHVVLINKNAMASLGNRGFTCTLISLIIIFAAPMKACHKKPLVLRVHNGTLVLVCKCLYVNKVPAFTS